MRIHTLIIITLCVMLLGCDARHRDVRLDAVADIAGQDPLGVLQSLDSIDYAALSESDRHFYDFLSIKAKDKAYIMHTSDSLILDVINWYGNHRKSNLYPETLYYGGRVYSDIGDYPSALHYFHMALDELPENTDNPKLRATVLSQTGRLLNLLRLYKEAEPYVERSIEMNKLLEDSVNEVNNLHLLGSIQLLSEHYDDAEKSFQQALNKGGLLPQLYKIRIQMSLAAVKHYKGQNDTALNLIRHIPESIDSLGKNTALAYAANIYFDYGVLDTAFYYAQKLVESHDNLNKQTGYHILLSSELKDYVHPDSAIKYTKAYSMLTEKRFDENDNQLALIQQSLYNYQQHDKNRAKVEKYNKRLRTLGLTALILLLIVGIAFFYQRFINKRNIKKLHKALENIEQLKLQLASSFISQLDPLEIKRDDSSESKSIKSIESIQKSKENIDSLRERLKKELIELYESSEKQPVSPIILKSEVYGKLQKMIDNKQALKDDDNIWNELENIVLESSPNFMSNLRLLTLGKLTSIDSKTALLLKCGMKPWQLSILFVKSNGAIVSRRESISCKIFGEKISVTKLDGIIRLL